MNKKLLSISIIFFVFLLDRFFKYLILTHIPEGGGFAVIPNVFHITRVNNSGAAFGMLRGYGTILVAISALFIAFLIFYLFRRGRDGKASSEFLSEAAWSLMIGGAAGNLFDRLRYGYVVDFLDFRVWPVFNLADASICLGVFFVVWGLWKQRKN